MEINEVKVNFQNWLNVYKEFLKKGYHVRLKRQTQNGKIELFIVYW